jgi:hypothetical protein
MGKTLTYSLAIDFHQDEGGYLAYFPALPGCHTWGDTYEQAVKKRRKGSNRLSRSVAEGRRENSSRRRSGGRGVSRRGCQSAGTRMNDRLPSCTARDRGPDLTTCLALLLYMNK